MLFGLTEFANWGEQVSYREYRKDIEGGGYGSINPLFLLSGKLLSTCGNIRNGVALYACMFEVILDNRTTILRRYCFDS